MLRERNDQVQFMVRVLDAIVGVGAFLAAYSLRRMDWVVNHGLAVFGPIGAVTWILAASLVIRVFLYPYCRFYESIRLRSIHDITRVVGQALIIEFLMMGSLVFIFQAKDTSRLFFVAYILFNYGLIWAEKISIKLSASAVRSRGYNFRRVAVVGSGPNALRTIKSLRKMANWGYLPTLVLELRDQRSALHEVEGVPVRGSLDELPALIQTETIDELFFALDELEPAQVQDALLLAQQLGITARFSLGFFDLGAMRISFLNLEEIPVLSFYTRSVTPVQAFMKRAVDLAAGLMGLILTMVLYPWIAYRIRRESPGPVIFKQIRVGENGRRFKCYKFRTMSLDAEARKSELLAGNAMEGPIFKIEKDPRVFPFGQFLRKSSLDELPQFLNVLRGDMSIVGTRPPTPEEVAQYEARYRRRLSIRPGLTGLWQISGRNDIKRFEDVVKLDLLYIDQWSLWLDLQIIFKTFWVVVSRRGAH